MAPKGRGPRLSPAGCPGTPTPAELRAAVETLIAHDKAAQSHADTFHAETRGPVRPVKAVRREGQKLARKIARRIAEKLSTDGQPLHVVERHETGQVIVEWRDPHERAWARYVEREHGMDWWACSTGTITPSAPSPSDERDLGELPRQYMDARTMMQAHRTSGPRTAETFPLSALTIRLAETREWDTLLAARAVLSWARHRVGWRGRHDLRAPTLAHEAETLCAHQRMAEAITAFHRAGLTIDEMRALRFDNIDLRERVIRISRRELPLSEEVRETVARFMRGLPTLRQGERLFARSKVLGIL